MQKRLTYNDSKIGNLGYEVYLQTAAGEQDLGFTPNSYFVYSAPQNGNYTFIVKSAYSIFKNNMSTGITINATVTNGATPPPSDDNLGDDDNETPEQPTPEEDDLGGT